MKRSADLKNPSRLLIFALLVGCAGLFSFTTALLPTEYLNITVEYNRQSIDIYVSGVEGEHRRIAVINSYQIPGDKDQLAKNLQEKRKRIIVDREKKGFEILGAILRDKNDKIWLFQLIGEYEEKGWELKSHDFAVFWDHNYMREKRIENFLLERAKK